MSDDMKQIVQAEKARLQAVLDVVTAPGATMSIYLPDGGSHRFEVDSFVVLRAVPQVDAEGNVAAWRYDLMFKEVGYDQGMQYVHLISGAVLVEQAHDQSVLLEDEHGNRYVANAIEPAIDPIERTLFAEWRAHKAEQAERFERIDRQFLDEYIQMVEAGAR
jgi:hypothetical protein